MALSTRLAHLGLPMQMSLAITLAISAQVVIVRGSPVHSSPTAGPLGITPGSPDSPGDDTTGDDTIISYQPSIRAVATIFAVFSALLIAGTYAALIGPGTRLKSTSKLPLAAIEANIGNLLSRTWPDTSSTTKVDGMASTGKGADAIRMVYLGKMDNEKDRVGRGVEQSSAVPEARIERPPMWITTGSSLTKSIVQLAVWEWVSIWMALAMMISTLLYNGFFTDEKGPDSYPRLVVILIYAFSFCVHAWYVWKTCRSFFTVVAAGASWSLLNKAAFASVDLSQLDAHLLGGPDPVFRQVGKPAASSTYPPYEASLLREAGIPQNKAATADLLTTDEQKGAADTVNDWQKRDVSSTVESGSVSLERIITNVMVMVGIIITTGFSVWTSNASADTTQLGSLALLASLTLGTGAMFSSVVELSVMESSFRNVLFLKEIMINGQASAHVQKRALMKSVIGFTHNTVTTRAVRTRDLVHSSRLWSLILFGPAYVLLPSEDDHGRQSAGAKFEFCVRVRDKSVILTTESTDRHNKRPDGASLDAINVCYFSESRPTSSAGSIKHEVRVQEETVPPLLTPLPSPDPV